MWRYEGKMKVINIMINNNIIIISTNCLHQSLITIYTNTTLHTNNIDGQQKGWVRGSIGTKLTIYAILLKEVQIRKINVSMCYIDYAKAFDSVPHD